VISFFIILDQIAGSRVDQDQSGVVTNGPRGRDDRKPDNQEYRGKALDGSDDAGMSGQEQSDYRRRQAEKQAYDAYHGAQDRKS
jgi:hypothetical protein